MTTSKAPMSDVEVVLWLTDIEATTFEVHGQAVRVALRTLAETRKALAACEDFINRDAIFCPICEAMLDTGEPDVEHAPNCIFATMPRPK